MYVSTKYPRPNPDPVYGNLSQEPNVFVLNDYSHKKLSLSFCPENGEDTIVCICKSVLQPFAHCNFHSLSFSLCLYLSLCTRFTPRDFTVFRDVPFPSSMTVRFTSNPSKFWTESITDLAPYDYERGHKILRMRSFIFYSTLYLS